MKKLLIYALLLLISTIFITASYAKYNRQNWKHWIDIDNDSEDTRVEILIRDNAGDLIIINHKILQGLWICPYTGNRYTSPRDLDIDHIVPLKNAYLSGAEFWTKKQKEIFANDQENLLAVSSSANRSKGNKSPNEYRPRKEYWREYALMWIYIKEKYKLKYTKRELDALSGMLVEEDY